MAEGTGIVGPLLGVGILAYAMVYSGVKRLQGEGISTIGALMGEEAVSLPQEGQEAPLGEAPQRGAGDAVVSAARRHIGAPYKWAAPGVTPKACRGARRFDCSGLTMCAWWEGAGVTLPHNSGMQAAVTQRIRRADIAPGDLVFMYHPISHVAIYAGGGRIIEATRPRVREAAVPWGRVIGIGRPRGGVGAGGGGERRQK